MRALPASKRLALAFALTQSTRELILADLHHRFPEASQDEIRRRFIARVLSRKEVIAAFGFDPREESH